MGFRDERPRDERLKDYRNRPSRGVFDGTFELQLAFAGVPVLEPNENEESDYEE